MKSLSFWKMQGCGNDFMVLDNVSQAVHFNSSDVQRWSHRRTGVGFDQLLLLEPAEEEAIDFNYRIFNGDGSEVEQCGNGARCITVYAIEKGLTNKGSLRLKTKQEVLTTTFLEGEGVRVQLGEPHFDPASIPFLSEEKKPPYRVLDRHGNPIDLEVVNLGNPHAVIGVEQWNALSDHMVHGVGSWFQDKKDSFPQGVNVGFAHWLNRKEIFLRVYERGVGETLACGTGACAAAVVGMKNNLLDSCVKVVLPGGTVTVSWEGKGTPLYLQGPVTTVFRGEMLI